MPLHFGPTCTVLLLLVILASAPPPSRACSFEAGDKLFDLSDLYSPAGYTMMSNGYQYRFDICNSCDDQCRVGTFATCKSQVAPTNPRARSPHLTRVKGPRLPVLRS